MEESPFNDAAQSCAASFVTLENKKRKKKPPTHTTMAKEVRGRSDNGEFIHPHALKALFRPRSSSLPGVDKSFAVML